LQFPSTLTGIGEYALYDCDELTSIEIPANVKNINNYAFAKCDKLVSVKYVASATPITINNYCFYNSPMLSSVTLAPNTY
ncbi:MAG: leucine-rich repeat domain-containing protein, partial [Muribaculaceae bacterium]